MTDPHAQTRLDMFESGWFGQGPAFWRWIETDAAQPYIRAMAELRRPPASGEFFAIDLTAPDILDPDLLAMLAEWIEAEHGSTADRAQDRARDLLA